VDHIRGMVDVRFSQPRSGRWRVPLLRQCRVRAGRSESVGIVCNVGMLGAYIAVERAPAVGDPVELSFQLPWEERPIVVAGVVSWKNENARAASLPPGCGVRFVAGSPDDRLRIDALVRAFAQGRS
jgi:hypothetical protein